jgi:phospholipid/cholesterol/gamma-HCH transport system ATP-binding protein
MPIRIRNLDFGYGLKPDRMILKDINLDIPQGKVTALMGTSGSGKTTLVRLIGGMQKPIRGTVELFGQDIAKIDKAELYRLRMRMGMLFQFGALFTDLSVFENVAFPMREHTDLPENLIHDLVIMKLNAVGLRGAAHLMPSEISGGMARRVAFARTIALDPELILFDEPFSGLDPISLGVAAQLVKDLNTALGSTSIVVSHDVEETFRMADHIVLVAAGEIAAVGPPEELRASKDPRVQQFILGEPDGPVKFHMPAKRSYAEDLAL